MDFVIEVNKIPMPGETILGKNFSLVPGGKGANQAYAIGKLGANVKMIGAVGNDEYGKDLVKNLNSVNVNTDSVLKLDNVNTGCAFINVEKSGENNIVVVSGANQKISIELIDNNLDLIDEADIIVMQLEIPVEVVNYAAKVAKERGKLVILDPAPAVCNLPDELLANVDIIKPNETEVQILSGIKTESRDDILRAAHSLVNKGVNSVIVTLGENGCVLVNKEKEKFFDPMKVNVVDTTAAGDSFTAALAKSLLDGNTIEDAIRYGILVSSISVTKKGAQTSIPSQLEIENFNIGGNNHE